MTVEDKAKRYADIYPHDLAYYGCNLKEVSESSFTAGYTQAITDISAENEKLRETLREAINLLRSSTEYEVEINRYVAFVTKAKLLITEEK